MQHDWILDVLEDLGAFARENGLPRLAEDLGEVRLTAMSEIASAAKGKSAVERIAAGTDSGAAGGRHCA
jgi:hypothetical protein